MSEVQQIIEDLSLEVRNIADILFADRLVAVIKREFPCLLKKE